MFVTVVVVVVAVTSPVLLLNFCKDINSPFSLDVNGQVVCGQMIAIVIENRIQW